MACEIFPRLPETFIGQERITLRTFSKWEHLGNDRLASAERKFPFRGKLWPRTDYAFPSKAWKLHYVAGERRKPVEKFPDRAV